MKKTLFSFIIFISIIGCNDSGISVEKILETKEDIEKWNTLRIVKASVTDNFLIGNISFFIFSFTKKNEQLMIKF